MHDRQYGKKICLTLMVLLTAFALKACGDVDKVSNPKSSAAPGPLAILTPSPLPDGTINSPYNFTLTPSGGTPPYTWTLANGSPQLPAGLTLNASAGTITGTPTSTTSPVQTEFKLTDSKDAVVQRVLSIKINAAPVPLAITTPSLPPGSIDQPYLVLLNPNGGTAPYSWALKAGSPPLPSGLTLDASGLISGTPTVTSSASHTLTLTDATSLTVEKTLQLVINANPLSITTPSLPQGTASQNYSTTLVATGGTGAYTWGSQPSLPSGLVLNASTGEISGIPTGTSNQTYTFTVTDQTPPAPQTATRSLQLVIGSAPPALLITTSSPLPSGTVTQAYTFTLAASGGTGADTWDLAGGSLPPGLQLNGSGVISGTPTTTGTFTATFRVRDSGNPQQTATKVLSLTIANPAPPRITTTTLPDGSFNQPYNQTLVVTGGIAPLVWSVIIGELPNGLSLDSATGVISGAQATATGTFNFRVRVTDAIPQFDEQALSITIDPPTSPSITGPSSLPTGTVNQPYPNTQLMATNGTPPYTWSVNPALPNGLSLNPTTGVISGTPLSGSQGVTNRTFTVTDSTLPTRLTATRSYALTINAAPSPLSITTDSLPNGRVNRAYSETLAASGGTPPLIWSLATGSLPDGLTLDSTTGVLSGTPTTEALAFPVFRVVDSASPQDSDQELLTIRIRD